MSKEHRVFATVVLIALLLSASGFAVFLNGIYPHQVLGFNFRVGAGSDLDEYSINDVWDFFNNSQISQNYTVTYVELTDDWSTRTYLEIVPISNQDINIRFSKENNDSYFWGDIEYTLYFPGISKDDAEASENVKNELENILDAMGEGPVIGTYYLDDNDFETLDAIIHTFLFFGSWAFIITYLFIMFYDGGKIFNSFFGGGRLSASETATPFLMFPGIWMLLMTVYINISKMWIIPAHAMCYTISICLVLFPLVIVMMDRKQRQRNAE